MLLAEPFRHIRACRFRRRHCRVRCRGELLMRARTAGCAPLYATPSRRVCREGARRLSSNASDLRSEDRLVRTVLTRSRATAPARRPGRAQHHAQHGQHCLPTRNRHHTARHTPAHCSTLLNDRLRAPQSTIHNHMRRSTDQGRRGWSAVDQRSRVPRARGCRGVWYWGGTHSAHLSLSARTGHSSRLRSHSRGKMPALSILDVTHIWQRGLGTCYVTTFARAGTSRSSLCISHPI